MQDYPGDIFLLLHKKAIGEELTAEEMEILDEWIRTDNSIRALHDLVNDDEKFTTDFSQYYIDRANKAHGSFDIPSETNKLPEKRRRLRTLTRRVAIAASLVVVIGSFVYYFAAMKKAQVDLPLSRTQQEEVLPAGQKATLILGDQSTIDLSTSPDGEIIHNGNSSVLKTDGSLVYKNGGNSASKEAHILKTPRGGHYQITLNDGTRVQLNAASTLKFPADFTGNQRKVSLEGEAYFEVAQKTTPFIVETTDGTVKVLGTHFNLKTYPEESMVTTLLEGRVVVSAANNKMETILQPGSQAIVKNNKVTKIEVDPTIATAWLHGVFSFDQVNLKEVMSELSRWYNVYVEYAPGVETSAQIAGKFERTGKLTWMLKRLESFCELKFELTGNTVYVKPAH